MASHIASSKNHVSKSLFFSAAGLWSRLSCMIEMQKTDDFKKSIPNIALAIQSSYGLNKNSNLSVAALLHEACLADILRNPWEFVRRLYSYLNQEQQPPQPKTQLNECNDLIQSSVLSWEIEPRPTAQPSCPLLMRATSEIIRFGIRYFATHYFGMHRINTKYGKICYIFDRAWIQQAMLIREY
jgi:hypothetical protein